MFRLRLFILISVLLCAHASDAAAEPVLSVDLNPTTIRQHDSTLYTVQIKWPRKEGEYTFAVPELNLTGLKTTRRGESQEILIHLQKEWVVKKFIFQLQGTSTGTASVNAFTITYVHPDQAIPEKLNVGRVDIKVIKPRFQPGRVHFILGGTFLGAMGGLAAWLGWRRKRLNNQRQASKILSKEDIFISRLQTVMEATPQRPPREVIYELGNELHLFLREYYQIDSKHGAQNEIKNSLLQKGIATKEIEVILNLMKRFHEAKYAGGEVARTTIEQLHRDIRQLIEGKKVVGPV